MSSFKIYIDRLSNLFTENLGASLVSLILFLVLVIVYLTLKKISNSSSTGEQGDSQVDLLDSGEQILNKLNLLESRQNALNQEFAQLLAKVKVLEKVLQSEEARKVGFSSVFDRELSKKKSEEVESQSGLVGASLAGIEEERVEFQDEDLDELMSSATLKSVGNLNDEVDKEAELIGADVRQEILNKASQYNIDNVNVGLRKTRSSFFAKLKNLFRGHSLESEEAFSLLEELLISSDLGVQTAKRLLTKVRENHPNFSDLNEESLTSVLKNEVNKILSDSRNTEITPDRVDGKPKVILVVGVNGVGKTTTIGKLASKYQSQGKKVLLAACDTFRAAAVEQIKVWSERSGVELFAGDEGAKPSTVAYQAVHKALKEDFDVLLVDTAGRLHNRVNLMNELTSVVGIIDREYNGAPHETILVLDASTGQNALQQAREFNNKAKLSGIVITKLDGTPKGGIVVAIKDELDVPIRYIGVGEGIDDLRHFSSLEFVEALFQKDKNQTIFLDKPKLTSTKKEPGKPKVAKRKRRKYNYEY